MSEYIIEKKRLLPRFENMIKDFCGNTSIHSVLSVKGLVDKKKFEQAVQKLVDENDVFRFVFEKTPEQSHCYSVLKTLKYELDFRTLHGNSREERYQDFLKQVEKMDYEADDMNKKRPWDIVLFELDKEESIFFLRMSHLIGDGQSNVLVWQKLSDAYKDSVCQKNPGFNNYLIELENYENSPEGKRHLSNWQECINSYEQIKRNSDIDNIASKAQFLFVLKRNELEKFTRKNKMSLFHVNLFCFHAALSKTFRKSESLIKVATGLRSLKYSSTVGFFTSGILCKFKIAPDKKMSELAMKCRDNYFYAEKNIKGGYSTAGCDLTLTYQNYSRPKEQLFSGFMANAEAIPHLLKLNFSVISVVEKGDDILFSGWFDKRLFSSEKLEEFKKNYVTCAEFLIDEDKTFGEFLSDTKEVI